MLRLRPKALLVVLVLAVVIGLGVYAMTSVARAPASAPEVALTPASALKPPTEMMGGCQEAALDHGHDVDPTGFKDQENDECVPGQHVQRNPDGSPVDG